MLNQTALSTPSPMLNERPEWAALSAHLEIVRDLHLRDLFAADPNRAAQFSLRAGGLFLDYSKQRITQDTMEKLIALAVACDVESLRDAMFSGAPINTTEDRAVLHTALRRPSADVVTLAGENIMPFIHDVLGRMKNFTDDVHSGVWRGHTGRRIRHIVNIGIGGSDLGPAMVCAALSPYHVPDMNVHFVSNIDGAHLHNVLKLCDPQETLFVVASKTFTTQETMQNALSARDWLLAALGQDGGGDDIVARHFVALSTNEYAVKAFGIAPDNMFPFRDWVGGRFSLWSSIGLSICLCVGFENFRHLLEGAYEMDCHFLSAPLAENMPVIMALTGIWCRNFLQMESLAILPYAQNLHRFPAFLQQLDMESNGKAVDRQGRKLPYATSPSLFGEPGTNGQHAFYQWLHQGTSIIPCDFIGVKEDASSLPNHHRMLNANMAAQAQALMQGRSPSESGNHPHKIFDGNRPSNTLLLERLDAHHLGMLIALYEHKIFVQGAIWNINSFDQWGVELGKILANALLDHPEDAVMDSSTAQIMAALSAINS